MPNLFSSRTLPAAVFLLLVAGELPRPLAAHPADDAGDQLENPIQAAQDNGLQGLCDTTRPAFRPTADTNPATDNGASGISNSVCQEPATAPLSIACLAK